VTLVRFVPLGLEGTAHENETILDVARRASAPIGNACGGTGVCGRCRVTVLEGRDEMSPPTWMEKRDRETRPMEPNERLACQAVPHGPVSVTASYWGKVRAGGQAGERADGHTTEEA